MVDNAPAERRQPSVYAEDLTLIGDEGPVFGPLNFSVPPRGITVLTGTGGSGRTALALVLAGRMKPTKGKLSVLGMSKPRDIRRHVAIAGVDQIDLLERSVTVRDILNENKAWQRNWFLPYRKADTKDLQYYCGAVYGQRPFPPLDAYISQIPTLDKILLRISLSLHPVNGDHIDMLVVDDVEQVREIGDRIELLNIFARLAEHMPVIVNSVNELPPGSPDHIEVELNTNAGHVEGRARPARALVAAQLHQGKHHEPKHHTANHHTQPAAETETRQ
ncbi:ATP-binding cassette domain-containing protein [Corynebacterium heidelbergense]|uniref:ABC transporter ATP-binding protein n=1 Tax=Corynebacterium heidelbergense TaxID=2055947 RepID=A0A364V3V1_9CORY|nr:ATP-binding cassette domain-containing protein [Corynebacterium heidelbergense]RAV31301.1 ABC transporter ATP-binding protein [Corynebacterium heidelbergense]